MLWILRLAPFILRAFPHVVDTVKYVEAIERAESGEVKKALAKKFLQEKLSCPFHNMREKDWDNLLGGLVDIAVALLNTFGWKLGKR